ncbi:MAG: Integral membrane protein [Hydrogenibacillus schlegelii]|uniref:Integral membrane protein n=2 Tax=Hydrogenibacillus schlegelii TaxID=1484 RepID=A0A2T5GC63_HYDSH|nr:MAG: Integral membrane protein [Hydrogenibacillus schlegelii]
MRPGLARLFAAGTTGAEILRPHCPKEVNGWFDGFPPEERGRDDPNRATAMKWLLLVGFAISSSVDNFGVGITYGLRRIRIPVPSNALIAAIAFLFSLAGILFGRWIADVLPGMLPVFLGSFLLVVIGLRIILLAVPRDWPKQRRARQRGGAGAADRDAEATAPRPSGFLTRILKHPEQVDVDRSQTIGLGESIVLGAALSANALTNGVGAGLFGLSPFWLSFITAIGSFVSVAGGVAVGERVSRLRLGPFTVGQFGTLLSGVMLILIALFALYD